MKATLNGKRHVHTYRPTVVDGRTGRVHRAECSTCGAGRTVRAAR